MLLLHYKSRTFSQGGGGGGGGGGGVMGINGIMIDLIFFNKW